MSHNCDDAIEQIYFYLDGEITWYRRTRVRRHLRRCAKCTSAFEFETRFKQVIRAKGVSQPPAELMDRLRTFLREHEEPGA